MTPLERRLIMIEKREVNHLFFSVKNYPIFRAIFQVIFHYQKIVKINKKMVGTTFFSVPIYSNENVVVIHFLEEKVFESYRTLVRKSELFKSVKILIFLIRNYLFHFLIFHFFLLSPLLSKLLSISLPLILYTYYLSLGTKWTRNNI